MELRAGLLSAAFVLLLLPAGALAAPALTLEKTRDVEYHDPTTLRGTLSGVSGGSGGRTVTLLASEFPYSTEAPVASTQTSSGGGFSFSVTPELNTRYRATFDGGILVGSATSAVEQVWVYGRAFFGDLRVVGRRVQRARTSFQLEYSPELEPDPLAGKRAYWYFRKTTRPRFRRVKSTLLRPLKGGGGGVYTRVTYRLPRSRRAYRFEFFPCLKAPARDIGLGDTRPGRCPRSFRARAAVPRVGARTTGAVSRR